MTRLLGVLLALGGAMWAQDKPSCQNPVFVEWKTSQVHVKEVADWWAKSGAKAYPKFCPVANLEAAKYVFIVASSNYQTAYTLEIPHTTTSTTKGTIDASNGDSATFKAETKSTEYSLEVHPTSCDQVHLYVYRKDDPKLLGERWYVYTPTSKAAMAAVAQILIAQDGSTPPSSACDYGKAHPAKDLAVAALKWLGK